jgi:hypothetical protein
LIVKGEPLGERFGGVGLLFSFGTIGKRRRGFVLAGMIVSVERVVVEEESGRPSDDTHISKSRYGAPGARHSGGF